MSAPAHAAACLTAVVTGRPSPVVCPFPRLGAAVLLLFVFCADDLLAQTHDPFSGDQTRMLETGFERDVNRYRWTANALVRQRFGDWQVLVDNRFISDAFVLFNDRLSFRDENRLRWVVDRSLNGRLSARARGRALWYTQSRVFSQEIYGGVRYHARPDLWIEPAVGFAWDQRPGVGSGAEIPLRTDIGPAYGTRLAWTPAPLHDYRIRFEADGSWQVINPRRGRAVRLEGAVSRAFEEARVRSTFRYSNYRRDAYQAVSFLNRPDQGSRLSETVEATASDTLAAVLEMEAPLLRGIRMTGRADFGANNRFIEALRTPDDALFFDTAFNRRSFDGELGVLYEDENDLLLHLSARGGAEVERRRLTNREDLPATQAAQKSSLLQQADYDQGLFALHARSRASLGRFGFSFDGSSSILRHDTPERNLDDRDELYHNGQFGVLVGLSRYLQADLRLLGTFYHTVYLDAERSAENNIQRSIRLRPSFEWTPSRHTRIRFGSEIRATYTVHDFVLPGRRASDQSAREMRFDTDAEHRFGAGLTAFFTASYSDLHLGRLMWDEFAEIPFDTLRTYSGWFRLQIRTESRVTADVGFRFYVRRDFDRSTTIRYERVDETGEIIRDDDGTSLLTSITRPGRSWIEQVGPTCSISWPMSGLSALRLDGWLNVQHVRRRLYGDLPDRSEAAIRDAGRRGDRLVIPNVSLTTSLRF